MRSIALSKSEILREWIGTNFDNNYDYSTMYNRTHDWKEFVNSHPEFDMKKDKQLYHYILRKVAKSRGIDLRTLGLKPHRRTFPEGDMIGKTTCATPPQRRTPVVKEEKPELENMDNPEFTETQEQDNFTPRSVGLTVKYSYNLLKSMNPFLENLTQEEQNDLGDLWFPAFNRFPASKWAILIIAILCTLFFLSTKLKDARQKAKNQNSDNEESS